MDRSIMGDFYCFVFLYFPNFLLGTLITFVVYEIKGYGSNTVFWSLDMNMLNLILPAEEAASLHKLNQLKDTVTFL